MADGERDFCERFHRRLHRAVRELRPAPAEADAILERAIDRLRKLRPTSEVEFRLAAERTIREAAHEWRTEHRSFPSSNDLWRELADALAIPADESTDRADALPGIVKHLPSGERDLLRRRYEVGLPNEQIATAEARSIASVTRDLTALHQALGRELFGEVTSPHAGEITRLTGQLADGSSTDDGRLVLETLLLGDAEAQKAYLRTASVMAELAWHYSRPTMPVEPVAPKGLSSRERLTTIAFVACSLIVLGLLVWAILASR